MPRPRLRRRIRFRAGVDYFKPAGVRMMELEEIALLPEELEALRLKDFEYMEQKTAAEKMEISQPTFHRILLSARKKVAEALVQGKAIRVETGRYKTE